MQHVALVYKRTRPEAAHLAAELGKWFETRHIRVFSHENIHDNAKVCCTFQSLDIPEGVDMAVVLGGDGTFLSVARFLEHRTTPIVGVNLGGLGFLTEISRENCHRDLEAILDGKYEIEERMRLQIRLEREGKEVFRRTVLNDAVINKAALARIVELRAFIDGRYLTHYRADGLIFSTPTGSTAYSLSAGGPIVYPSSRAVIMTPICPFTLANRPIILPASSTIRVEVGEPVRDTTLTCDGQVGCELGPLDKVTISAAMNPLRLIKTASIDYFEILRAKLKWGQN